MPSQPNPTLAAEYPILPNFAPPTPEPEPNLVFSAAGERLRERLKAQFAGSLYDKFATDEPIRVATPPIPESYGSVNFILDYPDPEQQIAPALAQIETSRTQFAGYRQRYLEALQRPPRIRFAPQSSLPTFANGAVPSFELTPADAEAKATNFLADNREFLGFRPEVALAQQLRPPAQITQTLGLPIGSALVHVRYQQWHGADANALPVYGGRVTMHMATTGSGANGDRPASVTSSYCPLPEREFVRRVEPERAKSIARQALVAYLTRPWLSERLGRFLESASHDRIDALLDTFAQARKEALAAKEDTIQAVAHAAGGGGAETLRSLWGAAWRGAARVRPAQPSPAPAPTQPSPAPAPAPGPALIRFGDALAPWLRNAPEPLVAANRSLLETPIADEVRPALTHWFEQQGKASDALDALRREIAKTHVFEHPEDARDLLEGLWQAGDDEPLADWQIEIAPYEGSDTFILPYAGNYHRAYLVEFLSPERDDGWRVFADAEVDGQILGRPERLLMHAQSYYESSTALRDHPGVVATFSATDLADMLAQLPAMASLQFYGGGNVDLGALAATPDPGLTQPQRDAVNVAYHAWRTLRHFVNVGKMAFATGGGAPKLSLRIGKTGTSLDMGFLPSVVNFTGSISFQTDPGTGLIAEGGSVFTPSLDPEIVVHELTHGLMWLLDRAPFDNRHDTVPFSRALIEGYAIYLAHSLLERRDAGQQAWARAAYRDDLISWGQRWSLNIPAGTALDPNNRKLGGLTGFTAPNYYPEEQTSGLPVYDVGMIWARALWDVRTMLAEAETNGELAFDGRDVADRLALASYLYVHGWSVNFEMAAEGLIAAAERVLKDEYGVIDPTVLVGRIINLFAARGILAERGVQAAAQVPGQATPLWTIGDDTGLRFSDNLGQPWNGWAQAQFNNEPLPGIVALAQDGAAVYLATENGIFKWESQTAAPIAPLVDPSRSPDAELLAEGILSLGIIAGALYAGTRRGIWRYLGNVWQPWRSPPPDPKTPVLSLTQIIAPDPLAGGANTTLCLVRTPRTLRWSQLNGNPSWRGVTLQDAGGGASLDWLTALCPAGNNQLYVATLHQESLRAIANLQLTTGPRSLRGDLNAALPAAALGNAKILCLALATPNRLFAGTTQGLFECDPAGAGGWAGVPSSPPNVIVTALAVAGNTLVAGTAADGFWWIDITTI